MDNDRAPLGGRFPQSEDVDACLAGTDNCDPTLEVCVNDLATGFHCEDVDPCAAGAHDWGAGQVCVDAR